MRPSGTMKARSIEYQPGGGVRLVEVAVTDPGPGEVQVRAVACGICAWDLFTYRHGSDAAGAAPAGHEGVGRVIKVGAGVSGVAEGDAVVARGFATVHNVPVARAYRIPSSTIPLQRWIVEPVSCVVTGLDHTPVKAGDRIALVGCGFMGLMLLQGLVRSCASHLVTIDVNRDRLELARRFGVDAAYHPQDPALAAEEPFDCVVDASGAQAGLDLATELLARGGRLNLFGWNHGRPTFAGDRWHLGGFTVVNSAPGSRLRDPFPPAIRLLAKGIIDLSPLITHTVPLDAYPELLAQVAAGDPNYLKGVVTLE